MPFDFQDELSSITNAFDLGDAFDLQPVRQEESSVFKVTTQRGLYALRVEGVNVGTKLSRGYDKNWNGLRLEADLFAAGAPLARPVFTVDGSPLHCYDGPPELFGGKWPFARVVSMHDWIRGTHPSLRTAVEANYVGRAVGCSLSRLHRPTLGADLDINLGSVADDAEGAVNWDAIDVEIQRLEARLSPGATELVRIMPTLRNAEEARNGDTGRLTAICHRDATSDNVIMTRVGAWWIDFDPERVATMRAADELGQLDVFSKRDRSFRWESSEVRNVFVLSAIAGYVDNMNSPELDLKEFARAASHAWLKEVQESITWERPSGYLPILRRYEVLSDLLDSWSIGNETLGHRLDLTLGLTGQSISQSIAKPGLTLL